MGKASGKMAKTGGYNTRARQLATAYLTAHKDTAVSVASILDYLHNNGMNTNVTTVYRYLDHLIKEGKVLKYMNESGDKAVFQYVGQGNRCHEHLHLKCISCGRVVHFDCTFMDEFREHIREHHGFQMECSSSVLYGYCENCISSK